MSKRSRNETNSKKFKKGAFQCMGLQPNLLKGVFACGYKQPTPIQREMIPVALKGSDIVAMARTGSGKTAAFLIPVLNQLLSSIDCDHGESGLKPGSNIRAMILSPTRELAIQTFKFLGRIGKYVCGQNGNLSIALITGGSESLDDQFDLLTNNCPHILVATIGRLLHLSVEMDVKKYSNVKHLVLDEADRLFEQAQQAKSSDALVQLNELLKRLPSDQRQIMLVSATLPKQLIQFANAGLNAPVVVRLDSDMRLSPYLSDVRYIMCRQNYQSKLSILATMLSSSQQIRRPCAIFVATKHDVELICGLMDKHLNLARCAGLYGKMDQTAREMALSRFVNKKADCLVVTDVAARGIDIPALDCVVNFNFPATGKLFIHRIGRVARKPSVHGSTAICLTALDDVPRVLDVHKLLGFTIEDDDRFSLEAGVADSLVEEKISGLLKDQMNEESSRAINGYSAYVRSCSAPTSDSVKLFKLQKEKFQALCNSSQQELCLVDKWRKAHRIKEKKNESSSKSVTNQERSNKFKDEQFFIPYKPDDNDREEFLSLGRNNLNDAIVDTVDDCGEFGHLQNPQQAKQRPKMRWDRRKKKYVSVNVEERQSVSKFKGGRYRKWLDKTKSTTGQNTEVIGDKGKRRKRKSEIKNIQQILKKRRVAGAKQKFEKSRRQSKMSRKK